MLITLVLCVLFYRNSLYFHCKKFTSLNDVPQVSSSVGSRAFSVAGPQAWNQLPTSVRQMDCIATFKRHLKTRLFMEVYCVPN